MRLIEGVKRPPLGAEVERTVSEDQDVERRRPTLASPFSHRLLVLDEQENGDVLVTRPDGVVVHVHAAAIESKGSK